jgi:dephospho-CoA kinase
MTVIGISGTNGSGKDTLAQMLVDKHGFFFASGSGMLREEVRRRGLPEEREHTRNVSTEWRKKYGLGVLIDKGVAAARSAGFDKVVVASLRNPGEADRVHELQGSVIWLDADPQLRYQRVISGNRGRITDDKTYEEFMAEEAIEMQSSGDIAALDMSAVKAKSDIFLQNDTTDVNEFFSLAQAALKDIV